MDVFCRKQMAMTLADTTLAAAPGGSLHLPSSVSPNEAPRIQNSYYHPSKVYRELLCLEL